MCDNFSTTQEKTTENVHIRIQQRTGRTYITTISGIPTRINLDRVNRAFKREFTCGGCIIKVDDENIIQLQGDQRNNVKQFLIKHKLIDENQEIIIHGF